MQNLIIENARRLFNDFSGDPTTLWKQLKENGYCEINFYCPSTDTDGTDCREDTELSVSPADVLQLMRLTGSFASPVCLSETLIARHLLMLVSQQPPAGPLSFATDHSLLRSGENFSGKLCGVSCSEQAQHVVCLFDDTSASAQIKHKRQPSDQQSRPVVMLFTLPDEIPQQAQPKKPDSLREIEITDLAPSLVAPAGQLDHASLQRWGAIMRSAQICGACEAVLELSRSYAIEREQFGRSLVKFQAIQHLLSDIACEAAACGAVLSNLCGSMRTGDTPALTEVAMAKTRTSEAAGLVARHSHQIHGAMGYTAEYALASLSSSLWRWRDDYGSEHYWATLVGEEMLKPDDNQSQNNQLRDKLFID